MKKIVALLLALSMVFLLCGCGAKASDVTVDQLGNAVGSSFSKQSTKDGIVFSDNNAGCDISGEADKDGHLYNVTIVLPEADIQYLRSQKTASDLVYGLNNYTKLKLSELRAAMFFLLAEQTVSLLSYGKSSVSKNATDGKEIVIKAVNSEITENGWKYAIVIDSASSTATFTATFVG